MTRARAHTPARTDAAPPRRVSHRHDATERQADRAADIVARGGSVTGWSFVNVPAESSVHRDEEERKKLEDKPKSQSESYAEGAGKVAEGLLKTKVGQQVQEKITSSKPLTGAIAAGMLAAGKEVPIPLGRGVTLGVKVDGLTEGKVNSAGITLSFGGGETRKTTAKPVIDRDSAKLMESIRAQSDPQPQGKSALRPLFVPQPEKDDEILRAPATTAEAPPAQEYDTSGVDAATRGGGRALDPALRSSMEARFGYDFSSVRLHDDPRAASAASGVDAAAFTVGEHIVFGTGRFDPSSPGGRHLLAHELAHVVQQRGGTAARTTGAATRVQRRSFWEKVAVLLGAEGDWSDAELRAYLAAITKADAHDGSYDADNKARAAVRKWKAGGAGWELTGRQMALLLDEMIDGPTLDDDENAILDLLENATADDLRVIFREPAKRYASLNDDLHGAQQDRFDDFVARRFAGGGTALAQGTATVIGPALPASSPSFAFDPAGFDARFEGGYYGADPADIVARFSAADRTKARDHVLRKTRPRWERELAAATRERLAESDAAKRKALAKKVRALDEKVRALDLFIAATMPELPSSGGEALARTSPVRGEAAKAARAALTPPRPPKVTPPPTPTPTPDSAAPATTTTPSPKPSAKPKQSAAERRTEEAARAKAEAAQKAKDEAARKAAFAPGGAYRTRVATALGEKITRAYEHALAVGKAAGTTEIQRMAKPAKDATDEVFGTLYGAGTRPELTFSGATPTLNSWHDRQTRAVKSAKPDERVEWALEQIRYYFRSDSAFDAINAEFDARPETVGGKRNDEAQALEDVAQAAVAAGVSAGWENSPATTADKLIYIDRNWGGAQVGGRIYVDLFQTGKVEKDRRARWDMFQTLIHEYGHTLAHRDYRQYAAKLGEESEREWNTLMEGVDSLLTDVVWARSGRRLLADRPTRERVEGMSWAKLPPIDVSPPGAYPSITEAQRLVDVVGADNVWAAYFLGEVDRIGGPSKKGTP